MSNKDPFLEIPKSYPVLKPNLTKTEIQSFLSNPDLKFLYFNKKLFHERLCEFGEFVQIDNIGNNLMEKNFYLILLINDSNTFVHYKYSEDFIGKTNEFQKNEKNKFVKIILCKIILELINNYEGFNSKDLKLVEIENDNKKIIENFEEEFKNIKLDFNLENIYKKSIDQLYAEIINYLIESEINNEDSLFYIFKNLDLEEIELTKIMFEKINKKLNEKYKLKNINDLFENEEIINYYYTLLKYVYKNAKYIEIIDYFLDSKKIILNSIDSIFKILDDKKCKNEKIIFIINKLTDNKYQIKTNDITNKNNIDYNIDNNIDYDNTFGISAKDMDFLYKNFDPQNCSNKSEMSTYKNKYINQDLNKTNNSIKKVDKEEYNKNIETGIVDKNKYKYKDNNDFLVKLKKLNKNDSTLKFIELKKIKLTKFDLIGFLGYIINNCIIVFIKEDFNKNELSKIYRSIIDFLINNSIDEEIYKTIFEIPTMSIIVSLTLFSKKEKKSFKLFAGKIIFNANNKNDINNKNGIFLVFQNYDDNDYYFPEKNYQVNYISPIYDTKNENIIFFITIGFEEGEQKIRLYEISYNEYNKLKIRFKNDIHLDITEKIESIKQLKTAEIVICFANKEKYLYSIPNLN